MKLHTTIFAAAAILMLTSCATTTQTNQTSQTNQNSGQLSRNGLQPVLAISNSGEINIVYGYQDSIFIQSSTDKGATFSEATLVGELSRMPLVMGSGPQISVSNNYKSVVAPGNGGSLFAWVKSPSSESWSGPTQINDLDGSAAESMVSTTFIDDTTLIAVWIDTRDEQAKKPARSTAKAKLFAAISHDGGATWGEDQLVYRSPEGSICECCKPEIASNGLGSVSVLFRNNLEGNRDMYLAKSIDGGQSFSAPEKLGAGSWKLNGCPVDGGKIAFAPSGSEFSGSEYSIWQRAGTIYTSSPSDQEKELAKGRSGKIAFAADGTYLAWQSGEEIMTLKPGNEAPQKIAQGADLQLAALASKNGAFLLWSDGESIKFSQF